MTATSMSEVFPLRGGEAVFAEAYWADDDGRPVPWSETPEGRYILSLEEDDSPYPARQDDGTWTVVDPKGGIWWPNSEADEEISAAVDPAETALRIATETPMRGTWNQ